MMGMGIKFTTEAVFVFQRFSTEEGQTGKFLLYLAIVVLLSIVHQFFNALTLHYHGLQNKVKYAISQLFFITFSVLFMYFLMTYNGYVIVASLLASSLGFLFFSPLHNIKSERELLLS